MSNPSLPTRFIGTKVLVEHDGSLVRFYSEHRVIKTNERVPIGGRCIDHDNYTSEMSAHTMCDPERLTVHTANSPSANCDLGPR